MDTGTPSPTTPAPTAGHRLLPLPRHRLHPTTSVGCGDCSGLTGQERADCQARLAACNAEEAVESARDDLWTNIDDLKVQVDEASVNNFLLHDKAKITATLESAASSAASQDLLRRLLEKTISANLAGNPGFLRLLVGTSLRNGYPMKEMRPVIVAALAGTTGSQSAEAVKKIVNFATDGTSIGSNQKELLVSLGVEAANKNRNVLSTARDWQSVFGTPPDVVEGTIAALIGSETGAAQEDSTSLAAAAFSPDAVRAGGLLLSRGQGSPKLSKRNSKVRATRPG